jgi:hypothetical protein
LEGDDRGQEERVDNRTLDEHPGAQEEKKQQAITRRPSLALPNFLPDEPADRKQDQRERHICADQRSEARHKEVESKGAHGHQGGNSSVDAGRSCQENQQRSPGQKRRKPPGEIP